MLGNLVSSWAFSYRPLYACISRLWYSHVSYYPPYSCAVWQLRLQTRLPSVQLVLYYKHNSCSLHSAVSFALYKGCRSRSSTCVHLTTWTILPARVQAQVVISRQTLVSRISQVECLLLQWHRGCLGRDRGCGHCWLLCTSIWLRSGIYLPIVYLPSPSPVLLTPRLLVWFSSAIYWQFDTSPYLQSYESWVSF